MTGRSLGLNVGAMPLHQKLVENVVCSILKARPLNIGNCNNQFVPFPMFLSFLKNMFFFGMWMDVAGL
jgi:hypothetical protein